MLENMDFHEPDLEDLIQSDLHTEMNKILDQSESEVVHGSKAIASDLLGDTTTSKSKLQYHLFCTTLLYAWSSFIFAI